MNILQLTTYPLVEPIHGGQIRSKSIQNHLKESGHTVISIAIYDPSSRFAVNEHDILFNPESKYYDLNNAIFLDYLTGQYATNTPEVYNKLITHIEHNKIEVIFLEQPWLYLIAKKLADKFRLKIIYSSQNIEYRLKLAMLKDKKQLNEKTQNYISAVRNLEKDIVLNSDMIIGCTQSDVNEFKEILNNNGLATRVILAGNGVQPFTATRDDLSKWKIISSKPYITFIGSAHEPNSSGFWEMMYPGLTFLKPDEEILVIGGVCDIILNDKKSKVFDEVNRSRLHLLGKRDLLDLQAIILNSHLVVLPICEGEGSNLKTAEALESGRPIVATSKAFRGYEEAMKLNHVYIEDDPTNFRQRIRSLLDSRRYNEGTDVEVKKAYYWNNQLKFIAPTLEKLFSK